MTDNNDNPVARSDKPADNTDLSQHTTNQAQYEEARQTIRSDNDRMNNGPAASLLPQVEIEDSSVDRGNEGTAGSDDSTPGGTPSGDCAIEDGMERAPRVGADAAAQSDVAQPSKVVAQGVDITMQSSALYDKDPRSTGKAGYDTLPGKVAMVTEPTPYTTADGHSAVAQPGEFMLGAQLKNGEFAFRAMTREQLNNAARMTEIKLDTNSAQTWFRGAPAEIVNRDIKGRYLVSTGEAQETVPMTPEQARIANENAKPIESPERGGVRNLFADEAGNVYRRGENGFEQLKNRHLVPPDALLKGQDFTAGRQIPVDGRMTAIKDVASDGKGGKLAIVPTGTKSGIDAGKTVEILPYDSNCVRLTSPELKNSVVNPATGKVYDLVFHTDGHAVGMSPRSDVAGKTESQTAREWQDLSRKQAELIANTDTVEIEIPKEIQEAAKPTTPEQHEIKIGDRSYMLERGKELTIGRKAGSDITMDSLSVSGSHGKFFTDESGQPMFKNLSTQTDPRMGTWIKRSGESEPTCMKPNESVRLSDIKELHIGGIQNGNRHVSWQAVESGDSNAAPQAASENHPSSSGERKDSRADATAPSKPFDPLERQSMPKEVEQSHIKEVGTLPDGRKVLINESIANNMPARLEHRIHEPQFKPDPTQYANITDKLPGMAGANLEYYIDRKSGDIFELSRGKSSSVWTSMPELTTVAASSPRPEVPPRKVAHTADPLVEDARAAIRRAEAGPASDTPIQEVKVENLTSQCGAWQKALVKARNESSDPQERKALDRYIEAVEDMKAGRGNVTPEALMARLREGRAAEIAVDPVVAKERSPLAGKVAVGAGVVVTVGALIGTYMALRNSMQGNKPAEQPAPQKPARPSASLR